MEKSINTKKLISSLYHVYSMLSEENTQKLDDLVDVIRNMELVNLIESSNSVCIAGMQGTGKTTLIKNLYDFPDNLLRISNGRGEKIPVIIREDCNLHAGCYEAKQYYINKYSGKREQKNIDVDDLAELSRDKGSTICLELSTSSKYFFSDNGAFILLPGFEKKTVDTFDDNYNAVINCCLHFSKAVLLVTDNQNIANSDIDYLIDSLTQHGFDGKNTVFAITKCDSNIDPDFAADVRKSLISILDEHKFDTDDSRIISCDYRTGDWIENITDALNSNVVVPFVEKKKAYLKPMIDQILSIVIAIENDLKTVSADIELNKTDSPVVKALRDEIDKSRDNLEKMINSAIDAAAVEADKNIAHEFEKPETQKLLKEKHFGLFKKNLATINQNHEKVSKILSDCVTSSDGRNILHSKVTEGFSKNIENYNIPCLTSSNFNNTLALCANNSEDLSTVKVNEEIIKKGNELVASFFSKEITVVEDASGKPLAASNRNVAKMIASSFNSSFITYYSVEEYLEEDLCNKMMAECRGSLSAAVRNYKKNNLLGKSALLTGLDVIDGDLDIANALSDARAKISTAVRSAVGSLMATPAGPYIGIAAAAAAITCGGVVAHNKSVNVASATQEAAKRAVRNQMYSQRDCILEKYDEGTDKMIEWISEIHNAKNNFNDAEARIRNANYAIQGIKSVCQDVYDEYANLIIM